MNQTHREPVCALNIEHKDVIDEVRKAMPAEEVLYEAAELFKVFGDSTRANILSALRVREMCVCDISALLGMTKSAVSHQLRILRQAKLVKFRKKGKEVIYALDDSHVGQILGLAFEHVNE